MDHQALRKGRKGDHARIQVYGQQVLGLWRRMNDEFMMLAKAFWVLWHGKKQDEISMMFGVEAYHFSCNAYASIDA